jgi:uncharacterized Tic20 family protein
MKDTLLILIFCIVTLLPPYFLARWVLKKRKEHYSDAVSMSVLAFIFGALAMLVIEMAILMSGIQC